MRVFGGCSVDNTTGWVLSGEYGEVVKHFAGAICAHWTTENKTARTRVSLDFRLIAGPMYHALCCGGKLTGGQLDVYRQREGYYSRCTRREAGGAWEREGPLLAPDPRIGFPWTVKDWDKFLAKNAKKRDGNKDPAKGTGLLTPAVAAT